MKNPDKVVVAILDQGVFPWWRDETSDLACYYSTYFDKFEMEFRDYTSDRGTNNETKVCGSHGYWVLDRFLEVCGDTQKIKVINCKIFQHNGQSSSESICNALATMAREGVDLVNMSVGIPRRARAERGFINNVNINLNRVVEAGGLSIISAGNEGEVLSNGRVIENTNIFIDDPNNNLSVASHNALGQWDKFSSVGGHVDVSTVGSKLSLVGERSVSTVSGTSFSAPTFTGICANYIIDQFANTRSGAKTVKEVIYGHLDEAIKPVYKGRSAWEKIKSAFTDKYSMNPWYGRGSFEAYARYFIKSYGRDIERHDLFQNDDIRVM